MELNDLSSVKQENDPPTRALKPQVTIGLACLLVGMSIGMSLGHSAVLLPVLQSPNSSLYIDEDTGSWIASVYAAAGPIGSLSGGIAMEHWGRRYITFIGNAGMVIGWILIVCAQNVFMLITGRVTEGFSRGLIATGLTVLVDELSDPNYRGFTLSFILTCVSLGVTTIMTLGSALDWRTASGIAAAIAFSSVVPLCFLRESPTWLVRKNRLKDARKGLRWLWGPGQEEQAEDDLHNFKIRFQPQEHEVKGSCNTFLDTVKFFFKPYTLKPFLILHFYNTVQAFCGLNLFTYYTIDILSRMRKEDEENHVLNDNASAVLLSLVRLLANVVTTILLIRIGRRTISMISGVGASVSSLLLCTSLFMNGVLFSPKSEQFFNLVATVGFVTFSSFGFFIIPPLMLGETQAARVRSIICGYVYTMNDLVLGGVVKSYPSMMQVFDVAGLFMLFGTSCLICTIFVFLFIPETQGKTLEEIEDYFRMPNIMWITRNRKPKPEVNKD